MLRNGLNTAGECQLLWSRGARSLSFEERKRQSSQDNTRTQTLSSSAFRTMSLSRSGTRQKHINRLSLSGSRQQKCPPPPLIQPHFFALAIQTSRHRKVLPGAEYVLFHCRSKATQPGSICRNPNRSVPDVRGVKGLLALFLAQQSK